MCVRFVWEGNPYQKLDVYHGTMECMQYAQPFNVTILFTLNEQVEICSVLWLSCVDQPVLLFLTANKSELGHITELEELNGDGARQSRHEWCVSAV